MKKFILILTILVTICLPFTLTACNSATPQGQLGDYFNDYEKFVYDVIENETTTGTYTTEIEKIDTKKNKTLKVGEISIDEKEIKNGHLISSLLKTGSGANEIIIETSCYFIQAQGRTFYLPKASYKKITKDGIVQSVTKINYKGSAEYNFKEKDKDAVIGSLKIKAPYYDNNEFYTMLRGASTMSVNFNMGYSVPIVAKNEIEVATISATCLKEEKIKLKNKLNPNGEAEKENIESEFNCYKVSINRTTKVPGISYTVYYAKDNISKIRGKVRHDIVRPILKIEEGNVTYQLTNLSSVRGEI